MLYYCVTVTIDKDRHDEWLEWMRSVHIPDVLRTGKFLSSCIYRILEPVSDAGVQYEIRYTCRSRQDYERYHTEHAPLLQAAHTEKFQGHFSASRKLLEALPSSEKDMNHLEIAEPTPAAEAMRAE